MMGLLIDFNIPIDNPENSKKFVLNILEDKSDNTLANATYEQILSWITFVNLKLITDNPTDIRQFRRDKVKENISAIKKETMPDEEFDTKFEIVQNISNALAKLVPLSFITFPHFMCSRYPDGAVQQKEYQNLGIVKAFKEICEEIDSILNAFSEVIK
jgi:hypothetical protein